MATVVVGACDKVPLMAPTNSAITVSAPTQVLASGGSAEITAFVLEEGGTPVQNGTTVRFSSTLGRVEPVEAQTTNGLAVTTFYADNSSGVAEIRATSGAAETGIRMSCRSRLGPPRLRRSRSVRTLAVLGPVAGRWS